MERAFEARTRNAAEELLLGVHGLGGYVTGEEAVDVNGRGALPCSRRASSRVKRMLASLLRPYRQVLSNDGGDLVGVGDVTRDRSSS